MNGPPLVIYGSLRRWCPQHFRATLQGYFLPASLAGLWGYRLAGLWTPAVNRFYLLSLPLVILATFLGRAINRRLDAHRFVRLVHGGLILQIHAGELHPWAIDEFERTLRSAEPDNLRADFGKLSKSLLALPQRFLGVFQVGDVGSGPKPLDNLAVYAGRLSIRAGRRR